MELPSSWCGTDLGPYRPCAGTYERYPVDSLPPVDGDLDGTFAWMGDRDERDDETARTLAHLNALLTPVGVALPDEFVEFYTGTGFGSELAFISATGCWTTLAPVPRFSPVEPGAFMVQFLSDQQDCAIWYLYLRQTEAPFVVHAFDLDREYSRDEDLAGVIFQCSSSFEEFAYRFWVEHMIVRHLATNKAEPLSPRLAKYVAHYTSFSTSQTG